MLNRRKFFALVASACAWVLAPVRGQTVNPNCPPPGGGGHRHRPRNYVLPSDLSAFAALSLILGRVSDRAATVSARSMESLEGFYVYGMVSGHPEHKTDLLALPANQVAETILGDLRPDTRYFYTLHTRKPGEGVFTARPEASFHTQRAVGSTFTFALQGDSHPERPESSDPNLYARTLLQAAADRPDFYICMGDDFSVDPVLEVNAGTVGERYTLQRPFLGLVAQSAPLFLLNGNHEQASLFNFNQTDVRHDVAVQAQKARNYYYPTLGPDGFFLCDPAPLPSIGLLKDYYAWTWGDALFVVLDNYWQSPAQVDSGFQEVPGVPRQKRDWWQLTLGEAQYRWFQRTLEQSTAKYKFVFAHHVMGSGRGGVEASDLFEWGGYNKRGVWEFAEKRLGWELPVHQLMVKHGVTIFFQGHDHLYARQERDGLIYQEVPMPADAGYFAYNQDSYTSGTKLPTQATSASPSHPNKSKWTTCAATCRRTKPPSGRAARSPSATQFPQRKFTPDFRLARYHLRLGFLG